MRTVAFFILLFLLPLFLILINLPRASSKQVGPAKETQPITTLPERIGGVNFPVSFVFDPDGRIFISERLTGKILLFENGHLNPNPVATFKVPQILGYHETGLLGIALDPEFRSNRLLYVYHTYRESDGKMFNRVVRLREEDGYGLDQRVILDKIDASNIHNGGVLKFGPDNFLYVSTGDANRRENAQDTGSLSGKVLRITRDGGLPPDNPFANPVYSLGHRNVFGMAFHPQTGNLYITENGPNRDDEINLVKRGQNYGWPKVLGISTEASLVNPLKTYTPNIAPTQMIIEGDRIYFADWNTGSIRRLTLNNEGSQVIGEDLIYTIGRKGIIDLALGPQGYLYFSTPQAIERIKLP